MANQLATIKTEVFDKVQAVVKNYTNSGELALPEGYSPDNAMKSAWIVLQEAVDTNKRPVLESCTRVSIINALQSMLYQGLNPDKKQGDPGVPHTTKLLWRWQDEQGNWHTSHGRRAQSFLRAAVGKNEEKEIYRLVAEELRKAIDNA